MSHIIDELEGICRLCEHRFRRVFQPSNLEDFQDEEGNLLSDILENGDTIVLDVCLLADIPMGKDITSECTHFSPREDDCIDTTTLLGHFK